LVENTKNDNKESDLLNLGIQSYKGMNLT